jgi:neopullulanase
MRTPLGISLMRSITVPIFASPRPGPNILSPLVTDFSNPPDWVSDAVFYQIFPDRFAASERVPKPGPVEAWDARPTTYGFKGGDLLGIVEQLDYIQGLGVNALYLTPVFASASNHRYHTYDYYTVDPLLGGNEAFRSLLDECHARGMRVVIDGVFNHSGRGFWPFHHVVETGASSPYVEWFYIDRAALAAGRELRPYPGPNDRKPLGYGAWWNLPALPKLNTNNPGLREHLMGAIEHWVRFGIDGWRLDVAEEIDAGFWREFRRRVRAINPDAYIVAEIWREKPEWVTGDTFDALMNYPLTEALLSFTAAKTLDMPLVKRHNEYRDFVSPIGGEEFARRLARIVGMYRPPANRAQLNLLGSHDTPRYVTVAGGDVNALRLALLAVMTLPGAPCIYYGDEIGLTGGLDPDNRGAFPRESARWDKELLDFVRCTTSLRASHDVLRHGDFHVLATAKEAVAYAMLRDAHHGVVVAMNSGSTAASLGFAVGSETLEAVAMPGWERPRIERSDTHVTLEVPPRSGAFLVVDGTDS